MSRIYTLKEVKNWRNEHKLFINMFNLSNSRWFFSHQGNLYCYYGRDKKWLPWTIKTPQYRFTEHDWADCGEAIRHEVIERR